MFWFGLFLGLAAGWRLCWWLLPRMLARAEVETASERMRKLVRRK